MFTLSPDVQSIDAETEISAVLLRAARAAYDRSPNAENARRLADARADVDRLLDERLAATC